MPICSFLTRSFLVVLLIASYPLHAQTPAEAALPDVPQTLEQADAQRTRAAQMRKDADSRYAAEERACYKKILVNDCLDRAKKTRTPVMLEARKLDSAARDFQREAKRADVAAKEAKRLADLPVRDVQQKERASTYRAEENAKVAEREKKKAAKAQKAAEGRQKTADEQARREIRNEKRAKQDADRAARKAKEAAKEDAKAAARATPASP